jgi:predicted phage terminase large subunit-like protein
VYLLDVFRKRLEFPDLKREVRRLQQTWGARTILMEDQASGTQLIQELNRDGHGIITPCKPVGDKVMRLHAQTATIEAGRVHIPADAPWADDYLHEFLMFPAGKHDDQVDSTAQFLHWLNKPKMKSEGAFEFMRREAEKVLAAQKASAPQPVKHEYQMGSMEWQAEQARKEAEAAEAFRREAQTLASRAEAMRQLPPRRPAEDCRPALPVSAAASATLPRNGPRYVRLKSPRGMGQVYTLSGKRLDIEPDMTVRMLEEDAKSLLASNSGWEKLSDENE